MNELTTNTTTWELVNDEPLFGAVPRNIIRPSTTNRKNFNQVKLNELAASIKRFGIQQPIIIRPIEPIEGSIIVFEIVAGERRWLSAGIAGLETVPIIARRLSDAEARQIQTIENLQREDLHPLEEAEGFDQLMKLDGFTADQLAEKIGKSRAYIYAKLKLLALSPDARQSFFDTKLSESTALLIARIPVPHLQKLAAEEILNPKTGQHPGVPMSVRVAAAHIQNRYMLDLEHAVFSIEDSKLVPAAGTCVTCPKRTGNQPEVFGDVASAYVCTDPDCFATKRDAHGEKVLLAARKKRLPIIEGKTSMYDSIVELRKVIVLADDEGEQSYDEVIQLDSTGAWRFDRWSGNTPHTTIDDVIDTKDLPVPAGYAKLANGSVHPVYTKSAIQAALEKAGLCLTLEEHMRQTNEKLQAAEADPVAVEREAKWEKEQAEKLKGVQQETEFRIALYRRIRLFASEALTSRMFRSIVKLIFENEFEWSLPERELGDLYDFSTENVEDIEAHIDSAPHPDVELLLMDMAVGPCFTIYGHYDPADDEDDRSYQLLMQLAECAKIDLDALRAELAPPPIEEAAPEPEPAKKPKGKKGVKAPAPIDPVKTPDAPQDSTSTKDARLSPWPFPTAAEAKAAKSTSVTAVVPAAGEVQQ